MFIFLVDLENEYSRFKKFFSFHKKLSILVVDKKTFLYYKYAQINLLGCTVHCLTESPPHQVAWKKFYYDVVKFLKEVPQLLVAVNYHHPGVRKV